ncbi:hypothetical protein [Deinococcus sp. Leaf326]|uniref:hypothetical protein n=1 Tax=Deinococcus sp. Leaf326 TaxID=1736338 RepID=UPI0006F6ED59|nr:hypothetical protein [Deinococcus sp. Leaf326]KQR25703.1 hypothetical protein ASF71_18630 [Deinococcus sp. Leaf326]
MTSLLPARPTTVTPRLGPGLLREIPRFFGGFAAALQELLQNSLRAGATVVNFHLVGPVLMVTDNGCGLTDPQVLLTAAESGWGEGIVEPAGLGALSILNPEFAHHVTYRSHDWCFRLTPEEFAESKAVPVEAAEPLIGFQVVLVLKTEPKLRELLKDRRGYAPITVRFNGEVIPPLEPQGTPLPTPAGTLYLRRRIGGANDTVIWEHFALPAQLLAQRLGQAASPLTAALLKFVEFTLVIDPASGLRPKLPDRNALLDDEAFARAVQDLATALERHVEAELATCIPHLGADRLTEANLHQAQGYGPHVLATFLRLQGYVPTILSHPSEIQASLGEDRDDDSFSGWTRDWIKPELGVVFTPFSGEAAALHFLRTQGYSVPYGTTEHLEAVPAVQVQGIRMFREVEMWSGQRPLLGLAQTLTLGGQPVPFAVQVNEGEALVPGEGDRTYGLILSGTPEAAEVYLRANLEALGGLLILGLWDTQELRDAELIEGPGSLSAREVGDIILHDFIQAFFPERAEAQAQAELLSQVSGDLAATARHLNWACQRRPGLAEATATFQAQLDAERIKVEQEHQTLVDMHRLT